MRLIVLFVALLWGCSVAAELNFGVYGGATRVDNVAYNGDASVRGSDTRSQVTAQASYDWAPDRDNRFSLQGRYTTVGYSDFSGLDYQRFAFDGSWRHQLGQRSWWRLGAGLGASDHEDDNRDTTDWRARAGLGTELGAHWTLEGGVEVAGEEAGEDAYGSELTGLYGSAQLGINASLSAYADATVGRRDVTSVSSAGAIDGAEANFSPDAVFGPGTAAYRLGSDYHSAELGLRIRLGPASTLRLGYSLQVDEVDEIGQRIEQESRVVTLEMRH